MVYYQLTTHFFLNYQLSKHELKLVKVWWYSLLHAVLQYVDVITPLKCTIVYFDLYTTMRVTDTSRLLVYKKDRIYININKFKYDILSTYSSSSMI
jgi:hypothetical protein